MAKFKIGNIVKIRSWEDMAEEFGTTGFESTITCKYYFTYAMKPLCGAYAEIIKIDGDIVELRFFNGIKNEGNYTISFDMIEKA